MPASVRVGLALTFLLVLPLHVRAQESGEGAVSLALGTVAPDAALEDLDGNDVQLFQYVEGKPALIEFWATWCELCEELQPELDEVQARYGDRVTIVAVAVSVAQSRRRVRRHVEDHETGYPYLWGRPQGGPAGLQRSRDIARPYARCPGESDVHRRRRLTGPSECRGAATGWLKTLTTRCVPFLLRSALAQSAFSMLQPPGGDHPESGGYRR